MKSKGTQMKTRYKLLLTVVVLLAIGAAIHFAGPGVVDFIVRMHS